MEIEMMTESSEVLKRRDYKYGFVTDVETEDFPEGLSEDIINHLSDIKNEPDFNREYRLKAFRYWQTLEEPEWAQLNYPKIDFQALRYYSAPKQNTDGPKSMDEVDPEILETFKRLGIPLGEQARNS